MDCEAHPYQFGCHEATDLVVTKIGPNRTAVMAALRAPMLLTPRGVGELVRGGAPIVVGDATDLDATEEHLKLCGATVERWQRVWCPVGGEDDDEGAGAFA